MHSFFIVLAMVFICIHRCIPYQSINLARILRLNTSVNLIPQRHFKSFWRGCHVHSLYWDCVPCRQHQPPGHDTHGCAMLAGRMAARSLNSQQIIFLTSFVKFPAKWTKLCGVTFVCAYCYLWLFLVWELIHWRSKKISNFLFTFLQCRKYRWKWIAWCNKVIFSNHLQMYWMMWYCLKWL